MAHNYSLAQCAWVTVAKPHVYLKIGDFWLPKENRSVSVISLGGRATLTIEYQNYEILSASRIQGTSGEKARQ